VAGQRESTGSGSDGGRRGRVLRWLVAAAAAGALAAAALLTWAASCLVPPGAFETAGPLAYPPGASRRPIAFREGGSDAAPRRPATGPLRPHPANPRWFADPTGRAVVLVGSHTWQNLQDSDIHEPVSRFDYDAYLDFLEERNHNFFRLWIGEQSNWMSEWEGDYWTVPMIWERTGPGRALDGKPRFDLRRFDPVFFERLRARVEEAGRRGFYVAVMLFNGWSVEPKGSRKNNPWRGHPFHRDNNVNGVDGDPDGDGSGRETHTLAVPEVTALQEAYVRRVVETVGDLDNVLFEISNESAVGSAGWQHHMIRFIRELEADRPGSHPIGMTNEYPGSALEDLLESPADWISPGAARWSPPAWCGPFADRPQLRGWIERLLGPAAPFANHQYAPPPASGRKVIVSDTDHLWGIGGDRRWVWRSFTRGIHPIFMDPYDHDADAWLWPGTPPAEAPQWESLRRSLGDVRALSERIPLARMRPLPELCSTGYCLASPEDGHYVVHLPEGGPVEVDLAGSSGRLGAHWLDSARRREHVGPEVEAGAPVRLEPPFDGDGVLWLRPAASARRARRLLRRPDAIRGHVQVPERARESHVSEAQQPEELSQLGLRHQVVDLR